MKSTEHNRGLRKTPFVAGPKGVDKVPVHLTHGEAVLPAKTVQQVGPMNIARLIADTTGKAPKQGLRSGGKYVDGLSPTQRQEGQRAMNNASSLVGDTNDVVSPIRTVAGVAQKAMPAATVAERVGSTLKDGYDWAAHTFNNLRGKGPVGATSGAAGAPPSSPSWTTSPGASPGSSTWTTSPGAAEGVAESAGVKSTLSQGKTFAQTLNDFGARNMGEWGDITKKINQGVGALTDNPLTRFAGKYLPIAAAGLDVIQDPSMTGVAQGVLDLGMRNPLVAATTAPADMIARKVNNGRGLVQTLGDRTDAVLGEGLAPKFYRDRASGLLDSLGLAQGTVASPDLQARIDKGEFAGRTPAPQNTTPAATQTPAVGQPAEPGKGLDQKGIIQEQMMRMFKPNATPEDKEIASRAADLYDRLYPPQNSSQKLRNPSFAPTGDGNVPRITPTRTNGGFYDIAAVPKGTGFIQRGDGPTHSFGTPSNSAQPTLQSGRQQVNLDGTPFKDTAAYRDHKSFDFSKMDFPTLVRTYTRALEEGDTATAQGMRPLFAMAQTTAGHGIQYAQMMSKLRQDNLARHRDLIHNMFTYKDADGKEQGGDQESQFYRHITGVLAPHGKELADVDPQTIYGLANDFKTTTDVNKWNEGAVAALKTLFADGGRPQKITSIYGKRVTPRNVGGVAGFDVEGSGWVPAANVTGGGMIGLGATDEASQDFIKDQQKATAQRPLDKGRQ